MAATSNPGHFAYSFNYDPVRFESKRKDWVVKLHMNTTRVYHNGVDVRRYLLERMPQACPKGFELEVHSRFVDVVHELDFSRSPEKLGDVLFEPALKLIKSTYPVLEHLFETFMIPMSEVQRAAVSNGRRPSRARATRGSLLIDKGLYSHSIPPKLRAKALAAAGGKCAICGAGLGEEAVHIDHIIPFSKGGLTELSNLQASHDRCNLTKGNRAK